MKQFVAVLLAPACMGAGAPTFYRDVLPILQNRCQECHRPGEIAPMPFLTYQQVRPWAKSIRAAVLTGKMPPWFADPCCGKFENEHSLSPTERQTLAKWAETGAAQGDARDAPPPKIWTQGWNLPAPPDQVFTVPQAFSVPASGAVEYQYFAIPTGFKSDRWIAAAEARPSNRAVVHHAVVYLREPGSTWTRGPTKSDILTIYTPGSSADVSPPGMAKLVKAGSDLVIEIHYTPNGKPAADRMQVAVNFATSPPQRRVLTLQMDNSTFRIPPGDRDYRVTVWGTVPNDALLLGFFPHMHLRGKSFEYTRIRGDGQPETLLKVAPYDFYWQLSYRLAQPMALKKGTRLEWIATFDNSANNPRNPDPTAEVRYGHQSWEEMMIGFFDVAVDPIMDKNAFFTR
ncbi:MAG TPA: thiol-disulfide isomerase [Bryobacteraceae bacterium]|nr:thiol-disulfide isomerase [Bryobacteraceae bacterium]